MIIPADFSTSVQFLLYFKKWELELQMIHYGWDLCNKDDVEILLAIRKKGQVTAWKTREVPNDLNKWTC